MAQRKSEEQALATLLEDIRSGVQNGGAGEALHGMEKRLATAQNWVVTPPTVKDAQFKIAPRPRRPSGGTGPSRHRPLRSFIEMWGTHRRATTLL